MEVQFKKQKLIKERYIQLNIMESSIKKIIIKEWNTHFYAPTPELDVLFLFRLGLFAIFLK